MAKNICLKVILCIVPFWCFFVQIHSSFSFSSAFNLYWGKSIHCLTRGYLWRVMEIARRLTPQSNSSFLTTFAKQFWQIPIPVIFPCWLVIEYQPLKWSDSYSIWNDNKTTSSLFTPNQPLTRTFQLVNTFPCFAPLHLSKLAKTGICTVGLHFHGGTCGRRSGSYCILLQLYGLRGLYHVLILGFLAGKVWGFFSGRNYRPSSDAGRYSISMDSRDAHLKVEFECWLLKDFRMTIFHIFRQKNTWKYINIYYIAGEFGSP